MRVANVRQRAPVKFLHLFPTQLGAQYPWLNRGQLSLQDLRTQFGCAGMGGFFNAFARYFVHIC